MGIRNTPFMKGMTEVVSMENISPAPIMAAKRMMTALSVKVTSPRAPVQAEPMVSHSALRRSSGVGTTGLFIFGRVPASLGLHEAEQSHGEAFQLHASLLVGLAAAEEIRRVEAVSGDIEGSLALVEVGQGGHDDE